MGKRYSKVILAGAIILVLAIMAIMTIIGVKDSSAFVDVPETDTNTVHVYEIIEVIKEVEVPVYTEIVREIEVPVIQEVEVIKEVEVVKEIEVPVYMEIIREIEVPVIQEVEIIKEVEVVKEVEVPVYMEIIREIEVPVIQEVEVIKEVEVVKEVEVPVYMEIVREIEIPVYIPCEHDQITEEVVDVRTTKFSLSNGSYILVTWNEEAVVDNVIHDILYYLLPVEFSGNGEAMTLTITGENCVFYSDRVEYDGIIIGYLQGEIVNGVMNVTEMSTSGVTLD